MLNIEYMDSQTSQQTSSQKDPKQQTRQAALAGLAVAGFIALVIVGITLAIYTARYIPIAISKIGGSSALFTSSTSTPTLSVVPVNTSIPFASSTVETVAMTPSVTPIADTDMSNTQSASVANAVTPAPVHTKPAYYGLPDLSVTVLAVGYLAGDTTDTFVATSIIPAGAHPAIKFAVKNVGTNVSGPWAFTANIPSASGPFFHSDTESSLNPGDHIDFTLGFNQTVPGNQVVSVIVDPANYVAESNKSNNTAVAGVAVQGY
jgi:hypothetical protein